MTKNELLAQNKLLIRWVQRMKSQEDEIIHKLSPPEQQFMHKVIHTPEWPPITQDNWLVWHGYKFGMSEPELIHTVRLPTCVTLQGVIDGLRCVRGYVRAAEEVMQKNRDELNRILQSELKSNQAKQLPPTTETETPNKEDVT